MKVKHEKIRLLDKDMPFKAKVRYVNKFVIKAFFLAILLSISLVSILAIIYVGDRFVNMNNNKKPIFGAYVIATPSMVPTLMVNDGIVVKREKEFVVGDIITFDSEDPSLFGLNITHRVVHKEKIDDGSYIYKTKGDNNDSADAVTVSIDNIYGKTVLKVPKIGYVRKELTNPIVLSICLVLPLIIIIFINFRPRRDYIDVLE